MTKIEFFANTFLFRNIPCEKIEALIKDAVIERCFERGELIYACDSFEKMLGFVFEGECEVADTGTNGNCQSDLERRMLESGLAAYCYRHRKSGYR